MPLDLTSASAGIDRRVAELEKSYHPGLHYFAVLTAFATLILIVAGGLVTSNDAGLSVPDWPLSFGQVMPEMVGGVFYEHGHRMIASTVGFLTVILAIWVWRREARAWVRRLAWLALAAVIAQGILGGITVLFLLPTPVSVLHACLAQTFFCLVITISVVTSRGWAGRSIPWSGFQSRAFRIAMLATAAVLVQLILGAIVRHSGTVNGTKAAELVTSALAMHLLGAVLATALILLASFRILRDHQNDRASRLAGMMLGLVVVQLLLGIGAFMVRLRLAGAVQALPAMAAVTTAHVATGALLLGACLLLSLHLSQSGAPSLQTESLSAGRGELAGEPL